MYLLILLIGGFLLLRLEQWLYNKNWADGLTVQIQFSDHQATEGQTLSLTETILNQKSLPLSLLRIKFMLSRDLVFEDSDNSNVSDNFYRDDLVYMQSYQKLKKTLVFRCSKRGYYTIQRADIISSDLLCSLHFSKRLPLFEELYVYPRLLDHQMIEIPFKQMMGTILTKRFFNEDSFEFAGIREYQNYDTMNQINWKASAKTGELKVNVHDYTSSQQVAILLNLEYPTLLKHKDLEEECIRLAATYANAFLTAGIPVSFATNAYDFQTNCIAAVPAGSGAAHFDTLMEVFSRINLDQEATPFLSLLEQTIQHTTVPPYLLVISTYHKEDLQERFYDLSMQHQNFTWILPIDPLMTFHVADSLKANVFPYYYEC